MEETISLQEIFEVIRKRLSLIVLLVVLATVTSGVVSYFVITPIYQSSTQILVNQAKTDNNPLNYGQIQTNVQLINTYSVIIKSPAILDKVSKQLGTPVLSSNVTVNSAQNSQVFSITVKDPSPGQAVKDANTIASVFQTEIANIMNVDNVSVLSKATLATHPSPVKPKPVLNMAIALVVGLMIGVGLAFLLEYLDTTIKTEQDIQQLLDLPVLGVVTEIDPSELKKQGQKSVSRVRGESFEA